MNTYCLRLKSNNDTDAIWSYLVREGCDVLYATEEKGVNELVIKTKHSKTKLLEKYFFIDSCSKMEIPAMDYAAEWERHAPYFIDGKVHLNLGSKTLYLTPGAGFGDLSHPTTCLVLELMQKYCAANTIVDIGSGSGILTLAALALGAKKAIGIDIDVNAINHAKENAKLNHLEAEFFTPDEAGGYIFDEPVVILMNMISSEQKVAWETFKKGRVLSGMIITSGILEEQDAAYQVFASQFNWKLIDRMQKNKWLGFTYSF